MNWGKGIIVAFAGFIGLIATMVFISMRTDVNLVAKDYYVQEIAYQSHIDKKENGLHRGHMEVVHDQDAAKLTIKMPPHAVSQVSGQVHLFRPSDAHMDLKLPLGLSKQGYQHIPLNNLEKGLWKVKVSWHDGQSDFYMEKPVVVP